MIPKMDEPYTVIYPNFYAYLAESTSGFEEQGTPEQKLAYLRGALECASRLLEKETLPYDTVQIGETLSHALSIANGLWSLLIQVGGLKNDREM